jgi:LysR family glycine cleavage system transcriptional activator
VWDGLVAEQLLPFRLSPHCTPDFAEKHGPFRQAGDLLSCPLVEREDWAWARWFEAAGCGEVDLRGLPSVRLHSRNLFGEAALASRGAALLNPELYAAEVAGGRLVQPFETVLDLSPRAFWLVYPETSRRSRAVRLFSAFLSEHVATSSSDSG